MAKLYIVPTPIGNLGDITFRAVEVLKGVQLILAEDTRTSGYLLKHYGIGVKMESHHMHNEHQSVKKIADKIESGIDIALISDAGTPGISDPGFLLVRECRERDIEVETLPGATAFVPALVNSGFPADRFCFEGFLPQKKGRETRLKELATESRTVIFYESPYRLVKTLKQLSQFFGPERETCVCRELTKVFEENRRDTLSNLVEWYSAHDPKGEIVLVVKGSVNKKRGERYEDDGENFEKRGKRSG